MIKTAFMFLGRVSVASVVSFSIRIPPEIKIEQQINLT